MAHDAVRQLYTRRASYYGAFVQAFGHRQGLVSVLAASGLLADGQRVLDAGCGTGLSILAINEAYQHLGLRYESIHGFDLTPAMIERCRAALEAASITETEIRQADALQLDSQLPARWANYDLIFSASMLEHVPRQHLGSALRGLVTRLRPGGSLIIVITRRSNYPTRWGWHCEGYSTAELRDAMSQAGATGIKSRRFGWRYGWLNVADIVVQGSLATGSS